MIIALKVVDSATTTRASSCNDGKLIRCKRVFQTNLVGELDREIANCIMGHSNASTSDLLEDLIKMKDKKIFVFQSSKKYISTELQSDKVNSKIQWKFYGDRVSV